nr:serine--tRNA ligase [Gemmatimonadaceae bacterium]
MLDRKIVRERPGELREAMQRRGALGGLAVPLHRCEELERERRLLIQAVDERKAARNAASLEVARRKRAREDADALIIEARSLGVEIDRIESELGAAEAELDGILLVVPNITLGDVPEGGEEANVIVRTWGNPRASDGVRPHWETGAALGWFDGDRASKISGSGFTVYRGAGASLVRSLLNFFLDTHTAGGEYEEVWPPVLVNRASMTATGQLPKFEDDAYRIETDDLFLVPTAEVPITNLYRDEILDAVFLPKGFCAYTPCFRREAGSAGKDTRGIQRMHQFDKVELVRYCAPEESNAQLELMLGHAEALLQRLELPYRVKLLAAGDTGFASAKTYDLEVWAAG